MSYFYLNFDFQLFGTRPFLINIKWSNSYHTHSFIITFTLNQAKISINIQKQDFLDVFWGNNFCISFIVGLIGKGIQNQNEIIELPSLFQAKTCDFDFKLNPKTENLKSFASSKIILLYSIFFHQLKINIHTGFDQLQLQYGVLDLVIDLTLTQIYEYYSCLAYRITILKISCFLTRHSTAPKLVTKAISFFMNYPSTPKCCQENTVAQKKSRVIKIELGSYNSIYEDIMANCVSHEQVKALTSADSREKVDLQVQIEGSSDLFPPPYKLKNKRRIDKKVKDLNSEIMPQKNICQLAQSKQVDQALYKSTLKSCSEIDLHFSLARLAYKVKLHIENNQVTNIDNIYFNIFGKYLQRYPSKTAKAEEIMMRVKRRILEVLRVLNGSNIIGLERRVIFLTDFGRLKGSAILKHLKRKKELLEQERKKHSQLIEYRDSLITMIKQFVRIRQRNAEEKAHKIASQGLQNEAYEPNSKFAIPLRIISGPSQSNLAIFKNPAVELIYSVQCKSNRILIKGGNLKIYSFGEVLCLIAKQQSMNN